MTLPTSQDVDDQDVIKNQNPDIFKAGENQFSPYFYLVCPQKFSSTIFFF